jgi:hypothetical protein
MTTKRAINPQRHFPETANLCACGDRFRSPDRFLDHLRGFMVSYQRGPQWRIVEGEKRATIGHGHALSFRTGLSLLPHMNKVVCSCGWSRYTATKYPGPFGRAHLRDIVKGVVYSGVER